MSNVKLNILVVPNSQITQIKSIEEDEIKILMNQPPENNKANKELCKYLSRIFRIQRSKIQIISGLTSKHKIVVVEVEENYKD